MSHRSVGVAASVYDGIGLIDDIVVKRSHTCSGLLPPANVHGAVRSRVMTGYSLASRCHSPRWIRRTNPQTLAYGLTDSPIGLAAWIVSMPGTGDATFQVRQRFHIVALKQQQMGVDHPVIVRHVRQTQGLEPPMRRLADLPVLGCQGS